VLKYNPDIAPDPARWLDSDEGARIHEIREYHKKARQPVGQNPSLHAAIHAVVENQLAEGHAAATAALSRLISEGLNRHDAIHAIGAIAAAEMFEMLKDQATHDPEQYARKLQALTAARWRAGSV
jgi:hypothetical protein